MSVLGALLAMSVSTSSVTTIHLKPIEPNRACVNADSGVDQYICKVPELIADDARLNRQYRKTLHSLPASERHELLLSQRRWLKWRDQCLQFDPLEVSNLMPHELVINCLDLKYYFRTTALQTGRLRWDFDALAVDSGIKYGPGLPLHELSLLRGSQDYMDVNPDYLQGQPGYTLGTYLANFSIKMDDGTTLYFVEATGGNGSGQLWVFRKSSDGQVTPVLRRTGVGTWDAPYRDQGGDYADYTFAKIGPQHRFAIITTDEIGPDNDGDDFTGPVLVWDNKADLFVDGKPDIDWGISPVTGKKISRAQFYKLKPSSILAELKNASVKILDYKPVNNYRLPAIAQDRLDASSVRLDTGIHTLKGSVVAATDDSYYLISHGGDQTSATDVCHAFYLYDRVKNQFQCIPGPSTMPYVTLEEFTFVAFNAKRGLLVFESTIPQLFDKDKSKESIPEIYVYNIHSEKLWRLFDSESPPTSIVVSFEYPEIRAGMCLNRNGDHLIFLAASLTEADRRTITGNLYDFSIDKGTLTQVDTWQGDDGVTILSCDKDIWYGKGALVRYDIDKQELDNPAENNKKLPDLLHKPLNYMKCSVDCRRYIYQVRGESGGGYRDTTQIADRLNGSVETLVKPAVSDDPPRPLAVSTNGDQYLMLMSAKPTGKNHSLYFIYDYKSKKWTRLPNEFHPANSRTPVNLDFIAGSYIGEKADPVTYQKLTGPALLNTKTNHVDLLLMSDTKGLSLDREDAIYRAQWRLKTFQDQISWSDYEHIVPSAPAGATHQDFTLIKSRGGTRKLSLTLVLQRGASAWKNDYQPHKETALKGGPGGSSWLQDIQGQKTITEQEAWQAVVLLSKQIGAKGAYRMVGNDGTEYYYLVTKVGELGKK